jgi:Glyoxalase superfamily protein
MKDLIRTATSRYERQAERLREQMRSRGVHLDAADARQIVAEMHGAADWRTLVARGVDAPECFHVSVIGTERIVGDHVYAFGLAGAMSVMLDKVRTLLRGHVFTTVKAVPDAARLLVIDLAGADDLYARVSLEYGAVQDAAVFVEVSDAIQARAASGDVADCLAYVLVQAMRMQEAIRPLDELPYEERLVEACRDSLESDGFAAGYAEVVLDIERLAREGKLMWRRPVHEVQHMVPRIARLSAEDAGKVLSAAAWALSFHGSGLEDVAYGHDGLRVRPTEEARGVVVHAEHATLQ